jgi:hypothetical protein
MPARAHTSNLTDKEKQKRMCIIDNKGKDYMKHAEKVCRKLKCCRMPFLPEASIWIRRAQIYYSLIKIWNKGNLKQVARRCNILNPLGLPMSKLLLHLDECKQECKFYQEHGKRFGMAHLNKCLHLAQEREDEEAVEKLLLSSLRKSRGPSGSG